MTKLEPHLAKQPQTGNRSTCAYSARWISLPVRGGGNDFVPRGAVQ